MKKILLFTYLLLSLFLVSAQSYPIITRLEGVGAGQNFLELADGEYDKILSNSNDGEVTYKPSFAPIYVRVINPALVKDGTYFVAFFDPIPTDTLSQDSRWILMNDLGDTLAISDHTIAQSHLQYIEDLGISILIGQSDDAGDKHDPSNGSIGYSLTYADASKAPWLTFIPDDFGDGLNQTITNFIQTERIYYDNYLKDPYQAFSMFSPWVPFILTDTDQNEPFENSLGWNITPGWLDPAAISVQSPQFGGTLQSLNNVDIILTSDTTKWSRCVVVETANNYYTGNTWLGLSTEGIKKNLQARSKLSVGKYDADNDGFPDPDGENDINGFPLTGMGWFPGYAVDVETGKRLNIFFGENSAYSGLVANELGVGEIAHDMIWNPGKQIILPTGDLTPLEAFVGGQQYVYVMRTEYDECLALRKDIDKVGAIKARLLAKVTWCSIPLTLDEPTAALLPLNEGLIPNDVVIKLRVDNPYQLKTGTGQFNGYPTYRFNLEKTTSTTEDLSRESNFTIYPNPASKSINIDAKKDWMGETIIRIFNSNGVLMMVKKIQLPQKINLDVSNLPQGIYFLELQGEGGSEIKKIVIQ